MRQLLRTFQILSFLVPLVAAQDSPVQLMKKVAANYSALYKTSYDFEQTEVRESGGAFQNRMEQRRRIVGSGGRFREEALPSGTLYLFDGRYRWAYNPDRNEYTKSGVNMGRPASLSVFEISAYRMTGARLLGEESLDLRSGPVRCQVIEVEYEPSNGPVQYSQTKYWVDPRRNLALKMERQVTVTQSEKSRQSTTLETVFFSSAAVGEPVDESLLQFVPPAEAVPVERLTFGSKSE